MKKQIKARVKRATVTLLKKRGQGVLVPGNLIMTAAHCIEYECEGEMVLGDCFIEDIESAHGRLKVKPLAVEPVSDIAVLGSLEEQAFPKEADRFEEFCKATKPLVVAQSDHELFQKFPVYIYTHEGTWVQGSAQKWKENDPTLWVEADKQIEGGTSGGPIINDSGELVGIASNFSEVAYKQDKSKGATPSPHLALPVWVCRTITDADMTGQFTEKQGQYLAFIYSYTVMFGRSPSEADLERFFQTSFSTVHQMVLRLEEKGFISRVPGQPRSIRLLVAPETIPRLRDPKATGHGIRQAGDSPPSLSPQQQGMRVRQRAVHNGCHAMTGSTCRGVTLLIFALMRGR